MSRFVAVQSIAYTLFFAISGCLDGASADKDSGMDSGLDTGEVAADAGSPLAPTELVDPCQGVGTPILHADNTHDLIVGCSNGAGLWHSTDGGDTFAKAHPSNDLYVFDLKRSRDGDLLVCGHDYEADGVLLYRGQPGGSWDPVLSYGNNAADLRAAYLSNCGAVAEGREGQLVVASLTAGDITWTEDGGNSWAKEFRYWEDDNLEPDGYAFHYLFHLYGIDGEIYGAGSQITEPPVFFQPSPHADADWWTLDSITIDNGVDGEVWALGTPDEGGTWVAGGRDQSASAQASGFLYWSGDAGETWDALELPSGTDIVRGVAFADNGLNGIAIGHKYPTSEGGFALVTSNGGQSWTPLDEDLPLLESVAVFGDTYWLAGDAWLSRGRL